MMMMMSKHTNRFTSLPEFIVQLIMASIFVILFLECFLYHTAISVPNITTDQYSLLQFKSKTVDPENFLKNWVANNSVCDWAGVTCGRVHQRVITLNVSNMGLIGNVPPGLGNLSFLTSLNLRGNNFTGILPEDLVHLRRLRALNVAHNNFKGNLPLWLFSMSKVESLLFSFNNFTGAIPPLISNLTNLKNLQIGYNSLQGRIPQEFQNLKNLTTLDLQSNKLTGHIQSIYNNNNNNISTLEVISLTDNQFNGNLPADLCRYVPTVKGLYLGRNQFSGEIPSNLYQCSRLQILALEFNNMNGSIPRGIGNLTMLNILTLQVNNFSGELPKHIGRLQQLEKLVLYNNSFSGVIPDSISNCSMLNFLQLSGNLFIGSVPQKGPLESKELSIITSLTNCRNLETLSLYDNPLLNGFIPKSIGNFSLALENIAIHRSAITGIIPDEIGNLSNLISIYLHNNMIHGSIPSTIKSLKKLQLLSLDQNQISGQIPVSICEIPSLAYLYVDSNKITGKIPECLGTMMSLRDLYLSDNLLESNIPSSLWHLKDLLVLSISLNKLSGSLPSDAGNLEALIFMGLSGNRFTGNLPSSFGKLISLQRLILGNNSFEGPIPESLGKMISLEFLDLSNNNLSGAIPKSFLSLSSLLYLNVSFNKLSGEIPNEGPFLKFNSSYFARNEALCGNSRYYVPPCTSNRPKRQKMFWWIFLIIGGVAFVIGVLLLVGIVLKRSKRNKSTNPIMTDDDSVHTTRRRISYQELLQATEHFNASNLLGEGGFGAVYKGVFDDGTTFAVKVFKLQVQGAFKSFGAECAALRNIRHRNLLKVITSCSNPDLKALVLEYMPNGSLDKWLHSTDNYSINMLQKLNIMVGVADALEYLHHGFPTPIVHCDLKPSNILLDENMTAHVSDFGLSKFMDVESFTHTNTLATIGYIAPEYGSEGLVSPAADVYSFGILLMETFTGKRPSDDMFTENLTFKDWVQKSFPKDQLAPQFIDSTLLKNLYERNLSHEMQCVSGIMELALNCCVESPKDRMNIKDVHVLLRKIKLQFQNSNDKGTTSKDV